jgi:hypothetical protein
MGRRQKETTTLSPNQALLKPSLSLKPVSFLIHWLRDMGTNCS